MAAIDLEALSLNELKQMQKDIAKAIYGYEHRQKADARAKVEAYAKELGFSLSELVGAETKITRARVAPKYKHPDNPALTWTGRGRQPRWFVDALASGKSPESLMIERAKGMP